MTVGALLAAFVTAGAAQAADVPASGTAAPVAPDSGWRFQATAYGWLTAVNGDVGVRRLPATSVDASIGDVLKDLDGALMGSFLATDGKWVLLADLVFAKLSNGGNVGPLGGLRLEADLEQTIATGAVGYWLPLDIPNVDLALTGGLRYVNLTASLSLTPAGIPVGLSGRQSEEWLDPTIGLALNWKIDEKWFVNAVADVGGFGVGSKLSSTGYVGVGYMWTPSLSSAIGYRYLYEDYQRANGDGGAFRYNTTMHGPTVSLAWHF